MKNFFKSFLAFLLMVGFGVLASASSLFAQLPCTISIDRTQPVCYDTYFNLKVNRVPGLKYLWSPTGDTTASINVKITHPTDFSVTVTNPQTGKSCTSPPFHVDVYQKINLTFKQLQLTCTDGDIDNGNTAQVKAIASGKFPANAYHYFWNVSPIQVSPGDPSLAIGLKAHQNYTIKVTDKYGCAVEGNFYTRAYSNPLVKVFANPDTIYIQNPYVKFSFTNLSSDSVSISNSFWKIGQNPNSYPAPVLSYAFKNTGTYHVFLNVFNQQGCDTVYTKTVDVLPVNLFIPNVFTPNGDGINDFFVISEKGSNKPINSYYESSELLIFNRWGKKVLDSKNYQNNWNGGNLPDGTYFYVLKCKGYKDKNVVYKGSVSIFAGH